MGKDAPERGIPFPNRPCPGFGRLPGSRDPGLESPQAGPGSAGEDRRSRGPSDLPYRDRAEPTSNHKVTTQKTTYLYAKSRKNHLLKI